MMRLVPGAVLAGILASMGTEVAAGRRVDVGHGLRLHIDCRGRGSPTVVMDAGLGDSGITWDWVRRDVAQFTRVCVYDRAGLGRSDPAPAPRTSGRIVHELHSLLHQARIRGPFVLVGHSFGGLNVRLFASVHPAEVAGLVLVDPTPEEYPAYVRSLRSPVDALRLESHLAAGPVGAKGEWESLEASVAELQEAPPLPTIPIVLLVASPWGEPSEEQAVWTQMQRRLASRLPGSKLVVAQGSQHYIQFERPEAVVEAVRGVVDLARDVSAMPPGSGPDRP